MPEAKKTAVEECLVLDVCEFARRGFLRPGQSGVITWRWGETITAQVAWHSDGELVYLPIIKRADAIDRHHHGLELVHTPGSTYGGERVWFFCAGCLKPVRKLYLPPDGAFFLCRTCHNLSYRSRQKRVADPYKERAKVQREIDAMYVSLMHLRAKQARTTANRPMPNKSKTAVYPSSLHEMDTPAAPPLQVPRPRGRPREKRPYHRHKPLPISERAGDSQAYCVKCRDFRDMVDVEPARFKNGRPALRGTCAVCGCRLARIVKKD